MAPRAVGLEISGGRLQNWRKGGAVFLQDVAAIRFMRVEAAQIDGMKAIARGLYIELDELSGFEALVAFHLDIGVVHKEIVTTGVRADEAVSFSIVEPLDASGGHDVFPHLPWRQRLFLLCLGALCFYCATDQAAGISTPGPMAVKRSGGRSAPI